ncbi:MAG TPA: isoprenylcysteine carboxylmethyltransferase family protein [Capsulimonadaceae bacterium]|jgi:protein-S-isoprenylcysteine O-methyltransferase Ste14
MNTPCCTAAAVEHVLRAAAPVSTAVVMAFVARNFAQVGGDRTVAARRPSVVGTATMIGFLVLVYQLIHRRIGMLTVDDDHLRLGIEAIGALLMVAGAAVNVLGRVSLGSNWANQATMYADQSLVTSGVFALVRHPLYSSLIAMFFGSALLFQNAAAALATALVFVPAMYYRASLEERLLSARFDGYAAYQKRVGMLFPRIVKSRGER